MEQQQIDPRPSAKEVTWLLWHDVTGKQIRYTHKEYRGSVPYVYRWEHLPSGTFGYSQIFGVSKESGDALVKAWGRAMPAVWKYTVVKQIW